MYWVIWHFTPFFLCWNNRLFMIFLNQYKKRKIVEVHIWNEQPVLNDLLRIPEYYLLYMKCSIRKFIIDVLHREQVVLYDKPACCLGGSILVAKSFNIFLTAVSLNIQYLFQTIHCKYYICMFNVSQHSQCTCFDITFYVCLNSYQSVSIWRHFISQHWQYFCFSLCLVFNWVVVLSEGQVKGMNDRLVVLCFWKIHKVHRCHVFLTPLFIKRCF